MRLLKSALVVAALAFAAPVWAHGGHGHGHHHGWDQHRHGSHWRDHRHYRHHGWQHGQRQRHYRHNYYYYPPYPAYGYAAPPPGVHIVVPNLYIPLR